MRRFYRYFCLGSSYSPFSDKRARADLRRNSFLPSARICNSDFVVVRNSSIALKLSLCIPCSTFVAWTNEPRYDSVCSPRLRGRLGQRILVFNCYTKNVFMHNEHFLGTYHFMYWSNLGIESKPLSISDIVPSRDQFYAKKTAIAVYERKLANQCKWVINGIDCDLRNYRQELALHGYSVSACDIAGKGWPSRVSIEESGYNSGAQCPWWTRKIQLLKQYRFSLAFENTLYPNYVTEKIWHSLCAGAVPVYWGNGSSIYEIFPRNSFVDASLFPCASDLWRYLDAMNYSEFTQRLIMCLEVFNKRVALLAGKSKSSPLDEVICKVTDALSGGSENCFSVR